MDTKRLRNELDTIINGVDTPMGRGFDILLIWGIVISSSLLILDSVMSIHIQYGQWIQWVQNIFLGLFTIEYLTRVYVAKNKRKYVTSFYGVVDFFAIAPVYLSYLIPGSGVFLIVRSLRLLRLFSILKMGRYISESGALMRAMHASKTKITVFLVTILFIIVIVGALMFIVEGPQNGFDNIPESMYWAVVTVSTVGYGDLSPQTSLGKLIASALMLLGYAIIAVPTGIITSEIAYEKSLDANRSKGVCHNCGTKKHYKNAKYCHQCGHEIS